MKPRMPRFTWARFLTCFIAAPLLFTLLTFWMVIPFYALIFGGPFYLIAGLPLAAWYLRRPDARTSILILLAMLTSLLQIPAYLIWAWSTGEWNILNPLPTFLAFGVVMALFWSSTFMLLYHLLARAEPSQKEPPHVHP